MFVFWELDFYDFLFDPVVDLELFDFCIADVEEGDEGRRPLGENDRPRRPGEAGRPPLTPGEGEDPRALPPPPPPPLDEDNGERLRDL